MITAINEKNFEELVIKNKKTVLLDFSAKWCGVCKMIEPDVEDISNECSDTVFVGSVDVDEEEKLSDKFDIRFVPTLIVFKNGKQISNVNGLKSKEQILKML